MLNRTIFAFAAIALLGSVSVASAGDVETQIGDKYPFLSQGWKANDLKVAAGPVAAEDVEARIGDKFPALEPTVASRAIALRGNTTRTSYEDVETHIGDKYPALERTAQRRTIFAMHRNGKKKV